MSTWKTPAPASSRSKTNPQKRGRNHPPTRRTNSTGSSPSATKVKNHLRHPAPHRTWEQELYVLSWPDVHLNAGTIKVTPKPKAGFSPKDYEERIIPIPPDLVKRLKNLPRTGEWIFPNAQGRRTSHLLRRLKDIAMKAKVENATLHKFRHTYATRLLESGSDIVTVQGLLGHSDIETTRQYLNPDEALKTQSRESPHAEPVILTLSLAWWG